MRLDRPGVPGLRHVWLFLFALVLGTVPVAAGPYEEGEEIEITGIVTDGAGAPISDLRIALLASRQKLKLTSLRQVTTDTVRVDDFTDQKGSYSITWRWHAYFNHFEVAVILPVQKEEGRIELEVLQSKDITKRIRSGSPLVVPITLEDTSFLEAMRDFVSSIRTEDERRIYAEMGKPDKIDIFHRPQGEEVSWWYFEHGRAYRFADGELAQVIHFDPIVPF